MEIKIVAIGLLLMVLFAVGMTDAKTFDTPWCSLEVPDDWECKSSGNVGYCISPQYYVAEQSYIGVYRDVGCTYLGYYKLQNTYDTEIKGYEVRVLEGEDQLRSKACYEFNVSKTCCAVGFAAPKADYNDMHRKVFSKALDSLRFKNFSFTPPPEPIPTVMPSLTPTPTPTPEEGIPGFEVIFVIAGLSALAYLLRKRIKN